MASPLSRKAQTPTSELSLGLLQLPKHVWRLLFAAILSVSALVWSVPPSQPTPVAARPAAPAPVLVSLRENKPAAIHVEQTQMGPVPCVPSSAIETPTPTATSTPTPTGTPHGTPTPTITPTANPFTPTATPTPEGLPTNCAVSASPALAINVIGRPHTFTFLCGASAALLRGPGPVATPPGCYDVVATLNDMSMGTTVSMDSATCGAFSAIPTHSSVDCTPVMNPICPAGFSVVQGSCVPVCPAGFTPTATGCETPPVRGVCPAGTAPLRNSTGAIVTCLAAASGPVTAQNEATFTFNPGAPHAYLLLVTGYVGTRADGTCPSGTTFVQNATLTPTLTGPACQFTVGAEKKYAEVSHINVSPVETCGGSTGLQIVSQFNPCFFHVTATGMVILKPAADCTDGSEPATGTDATSGGFPPGSIYVCANGQLAVDDIQVGRVPVNVTAENGFFEPTCFPQTFFQTPTPSPIPTSTPIGGFPTRTPVPTVPTPTSTPGPSPTPASPNVGIVCGPPGTTSIETLTDIPNAPAQTVTFSGVAIPPVATIGSNETIQGTFSIDTQPVSGVSMFATVEFPIGNSFCQSHTGINGVASCVVRVPGSTPPGTTVTAVVTFVFNCTEFTTEATFVVSGPGTPTPTPAAATPVPITSATAPSGICIVPAGYGPVVVTASAASTINTQPAVSSGPVTLGQITLATSTPVGATDTATPILTDTPAPTPTITNTPAPTPTITTTPTPTATPTASATPTITPSPTPVALKYAINAARVAHVDNPGNLQGLHAIHRGDTVWLMLYFSVHSIPKKTSGVSTYQIIQGKATKYSASFAFPVEPPPRSYSRVDPYAVPRDLPFGIYTFRASVKIAKGKTLTASWQFAVVRAPQEGY